MRASMPADDYCFVGGLDAAGWVLGALDPDESVRFQAHLDRVILIRPAIFARHERDVMTRSAAWRCS